MSRVLKSMYNYQIGIISCHGYNHKISLTTEILLYKTDKVYEETVIRGSRNSFVASQHAQLPIDKLSFM